MTLTHALSHVIPALVAVAAIGCSSPPKPAPVMPEGGPTAGGRAGDTAVTNAHPDTATPTSGSIAIEERILRACGDIPKAHFAFDSAQVAPDAANALTALARCFSTGPLAGKPMRLVGHADPRGESDYNLALGQRRAGSVAAFITGKGVPPNKVASTSRGSFDANGTDEEGWARDRRVDVLLAE